MNLFTLIPLIPLLFSNGNQIQKRNDIKKLTWSEEPFQGERYQVTTDYDYLNTNNLSLSIQNDNEISDTYGFLGGGSYGDTSSGISKNITYLKLSSFQLDNWNTLTFRLNNNTGITTSQYSLYFYIISYDECTYNSDEFIYYNTQYFMTEYSLGSSDASFNSFSQKIESYGIVTYSNNLFFRVRFKIDFNYVTKSDYYSNFGLFLAYYPSIVQQSPLAVNNRDTLVGAYVKSFFDAYTIGYNEGYDFYTKNYQDNIYSAGYVNGYNNGYEVGKNDGIKDGYNNGYFSGVNDGRQQAYNEIANQDNSLMAFSSLLNAILTIPFSILNGFSPFVIFNIPIINIVISLFLLSLLFYIISKFIKGK